MPCSTTSNGQAPPEFGLALMVCEALSRALARLWCWREFSLAPSAAVVAYASSDPNLALAIMLVSIIGGMLLLLTRPRVVAGALSRCRVRSQALSRRIAWPELCERLGWNRRLPAGGRLVPTLVDWQEDDHQVTIRLRPLAEHGSRAWDQMADALRRFLHGETVQWRESRGTLTVVISRHGLPCRLEWAGGLSDLGRIVLGHRHGGRPLALDARRTPHVLLAGATGSGKGGAVRAALAGALEAGWQAVVLDPKESGEYRWLEQLAVPVLCSIGEHVCVLEALDRVRQRRQAEIKRYGVDSWRELPAEARDGWRPILLVIDEAADLLVTVKGRAETQREHAALQQRAASLIAELARKGRSAGIHLILAIQRPDTAQLGDHGGALRNNLTARLALGTLDAEGLRMLGIPAGDPVALTLDGTAGRGICIGFGDDPRPSACQVAWIEQTQAVDQIRPAAAQGLAAIEPLGTDDTDNKREGLS